MMRALSAVLVALLLVGSTAHASPLEEVVIGNVGRPGMALAIDVGSGVVELRARVGGPQQVWRVHTSDDGQYLTITNWAARGCLTAPHPDEVLVLECIGTPSQSWTARPHQDGSRLLGNAAHPDDCLTGFGSGEPVELKPCAPGDPTQRWKW